MVLITAAESKLEESIPLKQDKSGKNLQDDQIEKSLRKLSALHKLIVNEKFYSNSNVLFLNHINVVKELKEK